MRDLPTAFAGLGPHRLEADRFHAACLSILPSRIACARRATSRAASLASMTARTFGGALGIDHALVDTSNGVIRLGHAARPDDAAFNDASAIDCAASLARVRLTMSLTLPFGIRKRHMPSQSGSGTMVASRRPERMRRR
jgi:hypothetical protein